MASSNKSIKIGKSGWVGNDKTEDDSCNKIRKKTILNGHPGLVSNVPSFALCVGQLPALSAVQLPALGVGQLPAPGVGQLQALGVGQLTLPRGPFEHLRVGTISALVSQ